jgi:hypothetical protein
MAHTLEDLTPGTPIFCGDARIGEVRSLYSEGTSRAVEWVIFGRTEDGQDVALPATEVANVNDDGVSLMHDDPKFYADLTVFSEARFPMAHRI